MNLDIILPTSVDVTPDGTVIECYTDDKGYFENEDCSLNISFCGDEIYIDYYSDDDRYILDDMFPDFKNYCTLDTFVQKQYEIAKLLGISTTDIN